MRVDRLKTATHVLVTIFLVAAIAFTVVITAPGIIGAEDTYVVRSESMSPSINAGDIVIVNSVTATNIDRGDVITYQQVSQGALDHSTTRITHRVVAINHTTEGLQFYTKGDANEDRDSQPIAQSQVIGEVWFHIPLIGWIIAFANTDLGRVLLLIVPGLLLIVNEGYTLFSNNADQ